MTTTPAFEAHGFTFRIASSDAEIVGAFDELLIDMRVDDDDANHCIDIEPMSPAYGALRVRVRFDDEPLHESLAQGSVISHVLMELNRRVASTIRENGSVPLHASTVTGAHGAVVLAGASHSGKTTLAAALALVGGGRHGLLADEVSAFDPADLVVAPYGKPAALRMPGVDLLAPSVPRLQRPAGRFERDERFVPPSEFGVHPVGPAAVAALVFPRFEATSAPGSAPRLDAVGPVDALTRLMQLVLGSAPPDLDTFRGLERLMREVDAYDVVYSDAFEAAACLAQTFDHSPTT